MTQRGYGVMAVGLEEAGGRLTDDKRRSYVPRVESDSATDFLRPPKHVISLLFWLWRTPEHIRFVFSLLLYRQILYNIVTRHGRSSQSRRTLRCRAQSPLPHRPTHLRHAVSAWRDFRTFQQVWQTQLPLRRGRRAPVAI